MAGTMKLEFFNGFTGAVPRMRDPSTLVLHQGNLQLAGRPDIDWSKLWLKTLEQEHNPLDSGRCPNLIGSIEEDVQKGEKYKVAGEGKTASLAGSELTGGKALFLGLRSRHFLIF
jgi:hypothetical protein